MIWMDGHAEREKVLDRRAAQVCQAIFENNRNHKKKHTPYKIEDFMPRRKSDKTEQQTPEQMLAILKGMFGSRIKAGGKNGN